MQTGVFPANGCFASKKVLTGCIKLISSFENRLLVFSKSTIRRQFQLGVLCATSLPANFENGTAVITLFLCLMVSPTIECSFSWSGSGKFWLYTTLSFFSMSFTLSSEFNSMSILSGKDDQCPWHPV